MGVGDGCGGQARLSGHPLPLRGALCAAPTLRTAPVLRSGAPRGLVALHGGCDSADSAGSDACEPTLRNTQQAELIWSNHV